MILILIVLTLFTIAKGSLVNVDPKTNLFIDSQNRVIIIYYFLNFRKKNLEEMSDTCLNLFFLNIIGSIVSWCECCV